MDRIDNNKVFCGLDTNTLFQKMDNNFVYAQNKEDIIFEPNSEGQLDFALWVSLIFNANPLGLISKSLNGLARMLGYVPKSGKGKINEKIKINHQLSFFQKTHVQRIILKKFHTCNICLFYLLLQCFHRN